MKLTDEQYERIGRFLDGEAVALDEAQRVVAEQLRSDEARLGERLAVTIPGATLQRAGEQVLIANIRSDEQALAARLNAPVPPGTFQRVHRRVVAQLARPQRRLTWVTAAAASIAVAAAVLLAVTLWPVRRAPETPVEIGRDFKPPILRAVPVEIIAASIAEPEDVAMDLLADEVDQLEVEMIAAAPPMAMDMGIDQIQRDLEEFWLDDNPLLD